VLRIHDLTYIRPGCTSADGMHISLGTRTTRSPAPLWLPSAERASRLPSQPPMPAASAS
jgi:hypothetical protein